MLEKAINALAAGDYRAFAACFAEQGKFFDYGPSCNGLDNYFAYGRAHIEMFFRNRLVHGHLRVGQPRAESETRGSYFASYDGPYVFIRFEIEQTDAEGLILKAVAHPA